MELEKLARKYSLQNAIFHRGKAELNAVISKIIAEQPERKYEIKRFLPKVRAVVAEINKLSLEQQKRELQTLAPELLVKAPSEVARKGLIELPEVGKIVVLRFAPNPSGPLHIGHSRAAILNDEYAKYYKGKLINRFEDTDPDRIEPEAYELIKEDLKWLDVKVHEEIYQSDRLKIYYEHAKRLLQAGKAYVCKCNPKEWRALKAQKKACKHRVLEPEIQLEEFDKMLANFYTQEEASVVIKTALEHPNPALRDFVALRICNTLHPRTKDKYIVYPLMNFAVALDDHLLGLTHILRGKDHLNNTYRQLYIFDYFSWKKPVYLHYGRVSIAGTILKTSAIKNGIKKGIYTSWHDPRLGTLKALAQRGITPEALRNYWLDIGLKDVDISFAWENLYAFNREIIDREANRYFFVSSPKLLEIVGIDKLEARAPLHPEIKERGLRKTLLESPIRIYLSEHDLQALKIDEELRLKDLCNIRLISRTEALYTGQDLGILKRGAKIIHWVSANSNIRTRIIHPDGKIEEGFAEKLVLREFGKLVQFERYGYVKISKLENNILVCYFTHK